MTGGPDSALALPPAPYVPGRSARPPESLFAPLKAGLSADLGVAALATSEAFLGGQEALGRGYYWEAHELFEAVWLCLPPASAERHLLRGLIQLANAGLKARMGRENAAARIRDLAAAALAEAFLQGERPLMGIPRAAVTAWQAQIGSETATNR